MLRPRGIFLFSSIFWSVDAANMSSPTFIALFVVVGWLVATAIIGGIVAYVIRKRNRERALKAQESQKLDATKAQDKVFSLLDSSTSTIAKKSDRTRSSPSGTKVKTKEDGVVVIDIPKSKDSSTVWKKTVAPAGLSQPEVVEPNSFYASLSSNYNSNSPLIPRQDSPSPFAIGKSSSSPPMRPFEESRNSNVDLLRDPVRSEFADAEDTTEDKGRNLVLKVLPPTAPNSNNPNNYNINSTQNNKRAYLSNRDFDSSIGGEQDVPSSSKRSNNEYNSNAAAASSNISTSNNKNNNQLQKVSSTTRASSSRTSPAGSQPVPSPQASPANPPLSPPPPKGILRPTVDDASAAKTAYLSNASTQASAQYNSNQKSTNLTVGAATSKGDTRNERDGSGRAVSPIPLSKTIGDAPGSPGLRTSAVRNSSSSRVCFDSGSNRQVTFSEKEPARSVRLSVKD
eukprot:GDKJ01025900.1.p1 GENE.GDKJ01025900.1~~GDKJ01025900.1.p1  ORF type:complete len:455 (-),score=125.40 GDKJ01025900.1:1426-2790(-)